MNSPVILDHLTALGDLTRARMLLALERRELAVTELCAVLRLPQSTVSRHLKTLAENGWVSSRREATSRYYTAAIDALDRGTRRLWLLVRDQVAASPIARQDANRLQRVLQSRGTSSRAFFTRAAAQWDRLRDDLFGSTVHLQAGLSLVDEDAVVADLGCGTGRLSEALAPWVRRVVAVDGSEEMLAAGRARLAAFPNVELHHAALEDLPIGEGEVDAAVLMLVLHHLGDPPRVLAEAARILRPGGRLVVVDMAPHDHEEYRQQMGHVWLGFSEPQMRKFFDTAGLDAGEIRPLAADARAKGPLLFIARGRRRAPRTLTVTLSSNDRSRQAQPQE